MSLHTPPRHRVSPPINSPFIKPFDSPSPDSQHFSREGIQISPRSDTTTSSPGGLSREGRLAGETSLDSLDVIDPPMALSDEMAEGLNDLRMEKRMKGRSIDTTTANALVQTFPSPPDVHPSLEELSPIHLPPSRVSPKSSEAPNINQSFLRWSQAGSTIFSDPAASTIAQPSKPSPRRNAPVPSTDKSFLRMSRTTFAFSDFAPSSGRNQSMSSTSERSQQDEEEEVMRPVPSGRTSYGTFGSHPRRRSAVPSTSTGSDPGGQPTQDEDNVAVSIRNGRNDEDSQSASSGQRRRPLSMSSTSESSFSAPASNTSPLLHVVAISTPAHLPSPTQRRPSHKAPETDQAITSHLLKSSAVNEVRIVPYQRSSPTNLGSAVQLAPPTCGTPLKAGCVKEERSFSDSSESGYGAVRSTKHPQQGMKPSKLDQVLGEGAETARVLMEFDRRAIRDTVKQLAHKSPGPLPPARGQKLSSSGKKAVFTPATQMNDQVSPSNPASPLGLHGGINSSNWEARFRSTSVESNLSLQSSIAESTNTLSRLIPQSPPEKSLPPLPASPSSKANFASPAQLAARNALSPGQRALLLKRTRKLEQMLGRPLDENQIERLVIDPHSARGALSSRVVNDTFPAISPSQADSVSKAAKRDARPRMVEALPPRSSSRSASRAASPLQSDRQENESSDDERKQLARAMRVLDAAANIDDVQRSRPDPSASPLRQIGRGPASLTAKLQEFWLDDSPVEDEATRRARRHQNAKVREYRLTELTIQLHRLLGVPIPPALVSPPIQDASRSSTPNDKSFFAFDEGPGRPGEDVSAGRVSKLRLRDKKKSTESSSFMDMRDFRRRSSEQIPLLPDLGDMDTVAARRKAWKLEQILGGTF